MVDLLITRVLSQGVSILEKTYFVAWDCEINRAIITYTQPGQTGMIQLSFSDDSEMTFPAELDAHRYLNGLTYLVPGEGDNSWRNLCQ